MNTFVQTAIEVGTIGQTENGDQTFTTSLNACVDLFFQIGAIRKEPPERIRGLFSAAYAENPDIATRIALWARDVRGGAGERKVFREIIKYLEMHDYNRLIRILHLIPEVGRWDDLFSILNSDRSRKDVLGFYGAALGNNNGLAAKWAPREMASSATGRANAKLLRESLGLYPKQYRKLLVDLTKVVETQMCAKEWGEINYSHVPSVASARYAKAFGRHDNERYVAYLESVKKGEAKINTQAVYPYDVIKYGVRDDTADVMWNNLPDYVKEGQAFLPIIDVSGSMGVPVAGNTTTAMDVAISLGLYLAEHNKSAFNRMCITFSANPKIVKIPGGTIREKVHFIRKLEWAMNTNLDRAMGLILSIAQDSRVKQEEMPSHLIILSDMEFDSNNNGLRYENTGVAQRTREMFKNAGYTVPNIVWWNIASRHGNTPVRYLDGGMALVSGFSPSLMKSLLNSDMNPMTQMLETVGIERYNH